MTVDEVNFAQFCLSLRIQVSTFQHFPSGLHSFWTRYCVWVRWPLHQLITRYLLLFVALSKTSRPRSPRSMNQMVVRFVVRTTPFGVYCRSKMVEAIQTVSAERLAMHPWKRIAFGYWESVEMISTQSEDASENACSSAPRMDRKPLHRAVLTDPNVMK